MNNKFEREVALCSFLIKYNAEVTKNLWDDLGKGSITPYMKSVITKVNKNIIELEGKFKDIKIDKKDCEKFIVKITDYYKDMKGDFIYLMKRGYLDALNETLPSSLYGDSFVSLVIADFYLEKRLLPTIDKTSNKQTYLKYKTALKQLIKFYKKEIIYSEEELKCLVYSAK